MSFPTEPVCHYDYEWTENEKGNFVIIEDGLIAATVFKNRRGAWQIMLPGEYCSRLVTEWFRDASDAMMRAEEILQGAPYLAKNLI